MNHNHMSHSKPKQNKPNTLLNFFPRTQSSSQINNTNRNNNRNVTLLSSFSTRQQQQEQSIVDLTDNNSDDDLIILDERPRSNNPKRGMRSNGFGSQSTQHSSQGFGSQGIQNQELSSMSKFKREPSYNFEQRQSPVFSSHTPSTSITGTNTAYSNTITNNRVVPVERKISQPSGMSLTDRPSSTASHPLRGAGMVSTQSSLPSGWVKTASTNSSSYTSSASSLKRPFSSTTSSSSSSFSSSSQPSTNKRHRDLPATFVTSTSALATLSGKSSRETIMKGFKSVSSTGKSYGPNSYTRQRNTPNKSTQNNRQYRPSLSEEQQKVFNMVVEERRSLFFTGSAGTGKSVLLRAIIDALRERYPDGVAITAPTGIAACNINGSTIHSFAGIGLGQEPARQLLEKVKHNKKASERWKRTRVLIIDEISMVDADLFDKIEIIARTIKLSQAPFGGIQLVVTGDFFQLPPVSKYGMQRFAFDSKAWNSVIKKTVMLTQVFRQKDQEFVGILNEMRLGRLSQAAIQKFRSLSRTPQNHSMIEPTELFALRDQVDKSNQNRLKSLKGDVVTFKARDTGDRSKVESCIAPETVHLKVDAQVMLLKNLDQTLVNGSLGIVVGFVGDPGYTTLSEIRRCMAPNKFQGAGASEIEPDMDAMIKQRWPIVQFTDGRKILMESEMWSIELPGGEVVASRTQIPLMLAWAMSIHKSQGQTLESVRVDLGKVFEKGQAYVALSRATSLDGLQILNFDESKVMAHERVAAFYQQLDTV